MLAFSWQSITVPAAGQGGGAGSPPLQLAENVQIDRADAATLAALERVKALLAERQWDEAVETLRQLSESGSDKLLAVAPQRFVTVRQYCQMRLAALPPEALTLYRERVDPLARKWYEEGIARRDRRLLENVEEGAFASRWGDKALMALGEIALEAGDFTAARWHWQRILPSKASTVDEPLGTAYPDSAIDPAAVRARLVLVSILEGSPQRAREELAQFSRLHNDAKGRMGGREVRYAEYLGSLLAESSQWPRPSVSSDWPTFAGSPQRNSQAAATVDPGQAAWRIPLATLADNSRKARTVGDFDLITYPLVVGDMVLWNDLRRIYAVRLADGKAVWGEGEGIIYRDPLDEVPHEFLASGSFGAPRFTMTALGNRLYARMGDPVTQMPQEAGPRRAKGYLVCLDLAAEGRLVWRLDPDGGWAFEGTPVADAENIYVAMRRQDVHPQEYVACFDAQTAQLRWRRFVCGAETPAGGAIAQITHNLLTLQGDTVYLNTNLGAVAALRASDGALRWLTLYPRSLRGDASKPGAQAARAVTPCLFDRGTLYVAPADSPRIFAVDAASGVLLWQTTAELGDVRQLLGVACDSLIASGDRLYFIAARGEDRGRIRRAWPDGQERLGYGRGVLAPEAVFWPACDAVYVFDAKKPEVSKTIDLSSRGVTGGNLLAVDGRLLVAGASQLTCLGPGTHPPTVVRDLARRDALQGITRRDTQTKEAAGPVGLRAKRKAQP